MKKLFLLFALVGMNVLAYSQDVKVNINNLDTAAVKDNCPYRINGICSSEDIGGVDVDVIFADNITWAVFTNYNELPVTVLYELYVSPKDNCGTISDYSENRSRNDIRFSLSGGTCGSLVLGVSATKKVKLSQYCFAYSDRTVVYDYSCLYSIKGLIVRKLSK